MPPPVPFMHAKVVIAPPDRHGYQVGTGIDATADRDRLDGVVVRCDAHVVVPRQAGVGAASRLGHERQQYDHRGPVGLEAVCRPAAQRAMPAHPGICGQPRRQLGEEVER